jgi:signal peptidase I
MERKSTLREYLESFFLAVIIVLFFRTFLAEAVQIPTGSMEDTLLPGDYLFINKFTYRRYGREALPTILPFAGVRRRDVIVFRFFDGPHELQYYVKRVIGLPGETVEIRAKQVYINGKPLDESYTVFNDPSVKDLRPRDFLESVTVPGNHFFVLGDNRDSSYDSRFWGTLPRDRIIGKPLIVWWSFDGNDSQSRQDGLMNRLVEFTTRFFRQTRWSRTGEIIR